MNFGLFLAHRMRSQSIDKSSASNRIIKIAIAAIALGLVMMLIAVSTSLGLQHEIKNKIIVFSGQLNITPFENNNSKVSTRPIYRSELNEAGWNSTDDIDHIQVTASKAALVKSKTDFEGLVVKGVSSDYRWHNLDSYLVEGAYPNNKDNLNNEILLSQTIAQRLYVGIGDRVTAYFQNSSSTGTPNTRYFKIVGIYQTGFPDFDSSYLFADIRHIQRINKWSSDAIGGFEVFLNEGIDLEDKNVQIYNQLPPHIDSVTVNNLFPSLFEWVSLFDFNLAIILILMLLVGTLNMATALLVLIIERSKMIGLLKAMGAKNKLIQQVFLWNALYIILKGIFIGNIIGLALIFGQKKFNWIHLDPATYYVSEVPILLSFSNFILLNAGVVLVCTTLLYVPSFVVTKIDPSKVMRVQ
ncbi:ABC transporter permease [Flavobacteriaceae bacterium]|nr:ABC transporter permease [Flavobacteriaceae bacterium]